MELKLYYATPPRWAKSGSTMTKGASEWRALDRSLRGLGESQWNIWSWGCTHKKLWRTQPRWTSPTTPKTRQREVWLALIVKLWELLLGFDQRWHAYALLQSKVLTYWFNRRCLRIGRINLANVGGISLEDVGGISLAMQCAYRSFLYYFKCCTMVRYAGTVPWAAQNGIVYADAAHVVKDKEQCKINPGSALDLKSIYVWSGLYVF